MSWKSKAKETTLGALVMGGDYRGLGLVRSLGRKGIPVWVIDQPEYRWAGMSRYARHTLFRASWSDEEGVNFLIQIGRKYHLDDWLLFPTSDEAVYLISTHHEELAKQYQLTVQPWETLQLAVNKRLMHQLADAIGVSHAHTIYPKSREELRSIPFDFPLILKPTSRERLNRFTAAKAWRADNLKGLLRRYDEACQLLPADRLMVQEIIPGTGESQFSFAAVCSGGRTLASLVARRTRQFPMDFGRASTFVETVEEEGVVEPAMRFLEAIQYTGLAEVEFKRDSRTGQFKLLDVNPRVWGWYSLCEGAGVNFGYLLWLHLQGKPVPEVHASPGVRWMRLSTDLLTVLKEIGCGRLPIREYMRSLRGPLESAIFSYDDPLPGLLEMPLLFYLLGRRIIRTNGSDTRRRVIPADISATQVRFH